MIVGFTGLAGSGKSTAADYLVKNHGFQRVSFAGTLKAMLKVLGLTDEQLYGDQKENPSDLLCGKTPRQAMQWLGTEFGRVCIHPDIWVTLWYHKARDILARGGKVVVDDCRFDNEYRMLESMAAKVCRIVRAGAGTTSRHVSEQGAFPVSYEIDNNADLASLYYRLDALVQVAIAA